MVTPRRLGYLVWFCCLTVCANGNIVHWKPPGTDPRNKWQEWEATNQFGHLVEEVWFKVQHNVGFCFGNSRESLLRTLQLSFPVPLPQGNDQQDAVCRNRTEIASHLCSFSELEIYYEYLLRTFNPEKVPDTAGCEAGTLSEACGPGFFDENRILTFNDTNATVSFKGDQLAHPCCEGYFCPSMLTCLIPCPFGSYCPRAHPADPPAAFISHTTDQKSQQWCAPYAYKVRPNLGCGGADMWTVLPDAAFPGYWWGAGSGSIYCDGGSFCPSTTTKLWCPAGHQCRRGSQTTQSCPPFVSCPAGTETPTDNYSGLMLDLAMFLVLVLVWRCSKWYAHLMRRMSEKERLRISMGPLTQAVVLKVGSSHQLVPQSPNGQLSPVLSDDESNAAEILSDGILSDDEGSIMEHRQSQSGSEHHTPVRRSSLLHWGQPRTTPPSNRRVRWGQNVVQPVWAGFSGPDAEAGIYQPLPGGTELTSNTRHHHDRSRSLDFFEDNQEVDERAFSSRLLQSTFRSESLLSSPMGGIHGGSKQQRASVTVEFVKLGLQLKNSSRMVLEGVSGKLQGKRLTAIMGPSGAGKTTLLNTLAGKATYGDQTGTILVNKHPDDLQRFKRVMGFVPQDDIMYTDLTVEENLMFAARCRLPAHYDADQHMFHVERAIQVLQLEDVRHEVIGDEETRGISGGQRKRVNVGLELVADPVLLFLDEPTSGLDSTASKMVIKAMRQVAGMGVTVAAVIHQPSYEIFRMFHDVLFLGKGGRTVYYGPQREVQAYFGGLGYQLPDHMNPADAYMDIISGLIQPAGGQGPSGPRNLFAQWEQRCGRQAAMSPNASTTSFGAQQDVRPSDAGEALLGEGGTSPDDGCLVRLQRAAIWFVFCVQALIRDSYTTMSGYLGTFDYPRTPTRAGRDGIQTHHLAKVTMRELPGFLSQFWWCLSRTSVQRMRAPLAVFTDFAIFALTGSMLGLISDRGRSDIMHYMSAASYNIVALGLMSTVASLKTFGAHRVVFFREASSGLNRLAYFCALDTYEHSSTAIRSALYLIMYYSFAQPRAVIWQMYLITLGIIYCCTGSAYFLSMILDPGSAQLSAAVLALVNALIAGKQHSTGILHLAYSVSFARWGLEGYIISEANRLTGVWLLARCADLQALIYDVRHFKLCLLILWVIGVCWRVIALLSMYLVHRDKTK